MRRDGLSSSVPFRSVLCSSVELWAIGLNTIRTLGRNLLVNRRSAARRSARWLPVGFKFVPFYSCSSYSYVLTSFALSAPPTFRHVCVSLPTKILLCDCSTVQCSSSVHRFRLLNQSSHQFIPNYCVGNTIGPLLHERNRLQSRFDSRLQCSPQTNRIHYLLYLSTIDRTFVVEKSHEAG